MTPDQVVVSVILVAALALFIHGRLRYDLVAMAALLACAAAGLVPFAEAFAGFGHPATITVAAVLVISRALTNSGAVEAITRHVERLAGRITGHVGALAGLAAALSTVMNNVGALALMMPVALQSARAAARSPSLLLMPLSFGSILGGLVTLIGTPPNIIVAGYRGESAGAPFGMFDYAPVGVVLAVVGVAFVALVGWRLLPAPRHQAPSAGELISVEDYISEALVPKESSAIGKTVREIEDADASAGIAVVALQRGGRRVISRVRDEIVQAGDLLVIESAPEELDRFVSGFGLAMAGERSKAGAALKGSDVAVTEAVVPPGARLEGRTAAGVRLGARYGVTLLGVARQGQPFRARLRHMRFRAGDVLLLGGHPDTLAEAVAAMGCLPLAERGLQIGKRRRAATSVGIFAAAIVAGSLGLVSLPVALAAAALILVALNVVPPREVYEAIDWPVIVLLGAMIPVAGALETTGTTELVDHAVLAAFSGWPPWVLLTVVMIVTMTLSDIMNNAATAVIMAPLAAGMAEGLGVNADPFLMAVAVGASCAFLTPIGHQNNTLVMGPGGYAFGDYWRMGLPLEALIVATGVPTILWVWPM